MSMFKPRLHYLIFYVTSRCNLRCSHCFYLDELNKHAEMSLEEIETVARHLKPLSFLRITGGEPFLRKDLPEVLSHFHHHASVPRMGIISNGTKPDKTEEYINRIFSRCPNLALDVGISIDGLKDVHDEIRGLKGAYDRAKQTVEILVRLKERYPNLLTSLVITLTAKNEPQMELLYDELSTWGVDRLSVNHVRGKVHDESLLHVPFERYRQFAEQCEAYHLNHDSSWKAGIQRAKNRLTRKAISEVVEGKNSSIPCLAGSSIGVLYSDGVTAICEMLEDELPAMNGNPPVSPFLGNIRDVDHDIYRLWHSEQADRCREWIRATNCSCTHECFLTASILFGKRNYPRLAREWMGRALSTQRFKHFISD